LGHPHTPHLDPSHKLESLAWRGRSPEYERRTCAPPSIAPPWRSTASYDADRRGHPPHQFKPDSKSSQASDAPSRPRLDDPQPHRAASCQRPCAPPRCLSYHPQLRGTVDPAGVVTPASDTAFRGRERERFGKIRRRKTLSALGPEHPLPRLQCSLMVIRCLICSSHHQDWRQAQAGLGERYQSHVMRRG